MAENGSRSSIFLVAAAGLLLAGAIWVTLAAYDLRNRPDLQATIAPPSVIAPTAARWNTKREAGFDPTRQSFARQTPGCGAAEPLSENRPIHIDIFMCRRPVRLSYGNLRISTMWRDPGPQARSMETFVTVRRRGHRPQILAIDPAIYYGLEFNIGKLDRAGNRYLMVQSYSGGPHCCIGVDVMILEGADRGIAHLGQVGAGMTDKLIPAPTDIDGDGRIDFIIRDDRFSQEFDALNGIDPPPLRIWNIRRGRAIEMSAAPRFRFLFQQDLESRRAKCLQGEDGIGVRSSCPGYVATAARLGGFRTAWRDLLRVYDRSRDDSAMNDDFTDHLRRFLRTNGYLRG